MMQKKVAEILPMQAMKLPALAIPPPPLPSALTTPPPPQDQVILMFMALVYLLYLPLVFVYFLHTIIFLEIKKPSMKNKANNQNDALRFRKNCYNK